MLSPARRARLVVAAGTGIVGLGALGFAAVGASGTRVVSDQLSYLATGGIIGATLVGVACAVLILDFLAEMQSQLLRGDPGPRRDVAAGSSLNGDEIDLHDPAFEAARSASVAGSARATSSELVHVKGSRRVHRADCRLVSGKKAAEPTTGAAVSELELSACGICQPDLEHVPC